MRLRAAVFAPILACSLVFMLRPGAARAQAVPAIEGAAGSAFGVPGGSGAFALAFSVGLSPRWRARSGATITAGRILGSVESTVDLERDPSVFVPYVLVGVGAVFGGPESAAVGVWGGGLRGRIDARTALLIEGRGFWVDEARAPSGSLTIGLRRNLSGPPR